MAHRRHEKYYHCTNLYHFCDVAMYHLETFLLSLFLRHTESHVCVMILIQYFARNWPWYSLRGLHTHMPLLPYMVLWYPYAPTSLYGNTAHCSGYGVAMGCYRLCIVPRTAIVTSQWYDRYCFTAYARTWARHPTTPWQRECTAITDCQSIDSL